MKTRLIALFGKSENAYDSVEALLQAGLSTAQISVVTPHQREVGSEPASSPFRDAEKGARIGALSGLLLGLTELSVPGLGPLLAGGWLATTLIGAGIGAASGRIAGALIEAGLAHDAAHSLARGIHGGSTVVTVDAGQDQVKMLSDLLNRHDPILMHVYRRHGG